MFGLMEGEGSGAELGTGGEGGEYIELLAQQSL